MTRREEPTESVRLLYTHLSASSSVKVPVEERLAVITNWLADRSRIPIFGDRRLAIEWRALLDSHQTCSKLVRWDGEPFVSPPLKTDKKPPFRRSKFTYIELFAGIGGFRLAMQPLGGECVFASEWDDAAKQTYFRNFGEYPFGDIRTFTRANEARLQKLIPDHDVLTAGFPCQPFSLAGLPSRKHFEYRTGFDCEEQGNLFYDIIRVAQAKRPRVIFLENVKNIVTHDGKKTFDEIRYQLQEKLEYSFAHKVIDASGMVPQKRERCYIVCFRKRKIEFSFPAFPSKELPLSSILEDDANPKYTISEKLWIGHQERTRRNRQSNKGFAAVTANLSKPSKTLLARYGKDGKECLIPQEGKNPRLLTPREAARLQGFPENYVLYENGATPYRQLGNAVVVPVIRRIAKKILKDYLS